MRGRADVEIIPATERHARAIAADLRAMHRSDAALLGWVGSEAAVLGSLVRADEAWAGVVGGVPTAIWGIGTFSVLERVGMPWLIGTPALARHAVRLARGARPLVARWRAGYARLENVIDARHAVAIRWLGWLGFTIEPGRPLGPGGEIFHRVVMPGTPVPPSGRADIGELMRHG